MYFFQFYPAEITGLSENTNVVRFVDYGNFEEVLKTDCLVIPRTVPTGVTAVPHHLPAPHTGHQNRYRDHRLYVPPPAQRK